MKYLRLRNQAGGFADALFVSAGEFIGANDAITEAKHVAAIVADYRTAYGDVTLNAVTGNVDPFTGNPAALVHPLPRPVVVRVPTLEERVAALEVQTPTPVSQGMVAL